MTARLLVAGVLAAVITVGCRGPGEEAAVRHPSPPAEATTAEKAAEHVAVFATGEPDELEGETADLLSTVADHVAVSPVSCWTGLPERLAVPTDTYVAAVVAATAEELDEVVAEVGRAPILRDRFAGVCGD
ncbi:MAG TPA: hypothetical protein VE754_02235 [Actinomycetota bacterium]|nr:hypothetical protein [Actinomycetota bacterium]